MTVEDDTAAIEMLAFSNVLNQYGGYLRENTPVVVTGRLSLREDKEPQIVINRARPISDFALGDPEQKPQSTRDEVSDKTLYLRFPSEEDKRFHKVKAMLNMFPGGGNVVLFFADTRKRRGAKAIFPEILLTELRNVLGEGNVVLK